MFKFKSRLQRAGAAADSLVPSPELAWAGENGWNGVRCDRVTGLGRVCLVHTALLLSRPDRPMAGHLSDIVRFEAAAAFWPEV